jgi:hypothetical protein
MRYLLKRNEFLFEKNIKVENIDIKRDFKSSALIRETFENDLSWGGSLIGRLINSTLRVLKIYVKTARITFVIPQLRRALDDLLTICRTNEEQRAQLDNLTSQFLLDEIINVVNSSDSVEQKVAQLLGADNDTNPGLVRSTIIRIEKIEGFEDKDEVITKLEAFLEALRRIKEEIGDLPDTEDEEGEEEGEGQDEGEGQGESEGGEGKSLSTQFQFSTITLFKALISLNLVFKNKRVSLEGDKSPAPVLAKSQQVLYTDPKGRQMKAVVLSVDHPVTGPGTDKIFLTKDDEIDSTKSIKPKVLIAIKNPKTGKIDMASKRVLVDATTLKKESVIFENAAEIKENELHAKAAWKKIQKEYVASNLASQVPLMEKLLEMRQQSDKSVSGIMKALMKQVFENEKTEGKIISFQDLIKENVNILQTEFKTLPKAISLMSRVIMAFKEDMGLLQSMGEAQKPLKSFIESYTKLKEILPKLSEEKPVEKKEEPKKNESLRLFEADEPEDDEPQGQSQDEPQDETESGDDDVKTAWREQFTEEEEKKYKIDEKGARELQNAVSGEKAATIDVSDPAQYDRILEIVKIFGRAYKMYAVDVIPSGRPEGRISQKTFREYEYIGKESSTRPEWTEDKGPESGPWAVRATYEKWQDGVMDILQDTKYRKILANSKFKNAGPNQEEGSGLTLFTFINDMLNEGGEYGTFRQRRHALLNKYFGGDSGGIEEKSGPGEPDQNPRISNDDMGTPGEVTFLNLSKNSLTIADFRKNAKPICYSNTFFKVRVKGTEIKSYIIFINGIPKPSDVGGKTVLAIKMHRNDPAKIKQSLITSYMSDYFDGEDALKLDKNITNNPNESVYVGIIEFEKPESKIFQKNGKMKIKYLKSELLNAEDPITEEFTVQDVNILGYSDKKKKTIVPLIRRGAPKSRPTNDKVSGLIEKLKNDKIKKKFGLVKK